MIQVYNLCLGSQTYRVQRFSRKVGGGYYAAHKNISILVCSRINIYVFYLVLAYTTISVY